MKVILLTALLCLGAMCTAENIDPYDGGAQYGWGENVGWLNFEPSAGPGVQVEGDKLAGFVWAENIGWVNLSCQTTAYCASVSFGVVNDGSGSLSGFAWAENAGWINFDPVVPGDAANVYKVTVDADGRFDGWAWGENIGWVRFDSAQSWSVRACVVALDDLVNFASDWLSKSAGAAANLDALGRVDMDDYAIFASYWRYFCPDGWRLK